MFPSRMPSELATRASFAVLLVTFETFCANADLVVALSVHVQESIAIAGVGLAV